MSYIRVIPRDFFNESKLLKCLGKLSLNILDNKDHVKKYLTEQFDNVDSFNIQQDESSGDIYCINYNLFNELGDEILLSSLLNSKLNWPLLFETDSIKELVFQDDGEFSQEFLDYVKIGEH